MQAQLQASFPYMDTEINIATYDENGAPVCRPMTEEELAELEATRALMTPVPLPE